MTNALEWLCPTAQAAQPENFWQVLLVAAIWGVLRFVVKPDEAKIKSLLETSERYSPRLWFARNAILPALTLVLIVVVAGFEVMGIPVPAIRVATVLLFIWSLIGLATSFIPDAFWAESTALVLTVMTIFPVLTVDDTLIQFLDQMQLPIPAGENNLSVWKLFTVAASVAVAIWIGLGLSQFIERRVETIDRIDASTRALVEKIIRVIFIIFALIVGLTSVGVNLSALTVFGGAFALGLGFGLQKIVSNLISGFILLSDRSIKPGDVIEMQDSNTYGWINSLRARYVSVITRDGTEHLIPNEDLITQKVINWSFSHDRVRIKAQVGVSYKEDPHRVIEICQEAAKKHKRVLDDPAPVCLLTGFGDSSVDLELRFWIRDPNQGVANLRSAVLLEIWDRFKEEGIEIPFPQRDLHLKSGWPPEKEPEQE